MAGISVEHEEFRLLNLSQYNVTLDDLQLALNLSAQAEMADCYCSHRVSTTRHLATEHHHLLKHSLGGRRATTVQRGDIGQQAATLQTEGSKNVSTFQ